MTEQIIRRKLLNQGYDVMHIMRFYKHWGEDWFEPRYYMEGYTAFLMNSLGLLEKNKSFFKKII